MQKHFKLIRLMVTVAVMCILTAPAALAATPFSDDGRGNGIVKEGYFLSDTAEIISNDGGTGYFLNEENVVDNDGIEVLNPITADALKISNWKEVFKRTPWDYVPMVKEILNEEKIQELLQTAGLTQAGNVWNAPEGSRIDCPGSLWYSTGEKLDVIGWILKRSPLLIGNNGGIHVVTGKKFPSDELITAYTGKTLNLDTVYRKACAPEGGAVAGQAGEKGKKGPGPSAHEKAIAEFINGIKVNPAEQGSPVTEAAVKKKLEQIAVALDKTGANLADIPVSVLDMIERDLKDGALSVANREAIIALGVSLGRKPQEIARYLEEAENPLQARLTDFSNRASKHKIYLGDDTTSYNQYLHKQGGVRDIFDQIFFRFKISTLVIGPDGTEGHIVKKQAWKVVLNEDGVEIDRIELKPGFDLQVGRDAAPTMITRDGKFYKSIDNALAERQTDVTGNWLTYFGYLALSSPPPVIHRYEKPGELKKLAPIEGVDSKLTLANILGLQATNDSTDFVRQGAIPAGARGQIGNNGLAAGYSFVSKKPNPQ